jgi:RNA polymerase primary sigma factor
MEQEPKSPTLQELVNQQENSTEQIPDETARDHAAKQLGHEAVSATDGVAGKDNQETDAEDTTATQEIESQANDNHKHQNQLTRPSPPRDNSWRQSHRKKIPRRTDHAREQRPQLNTISIEPGMDGLKLFFQEVSKYPLLTADEEIYLAKRIERGDMDAKDRMITSNLRLVIHVARGYQGQGLDFNDLIGEGIVGLIRAAEKFDWRKGFKFSTYATLWIRQSIQRGLANTGRVIRLPAHIGQRERKVARAEKELTVRLGREPTIDELAAEIDDLNTEQINDVKTLADVVASLDQPVGEDGETTFGALFEDKSKTVEDEAEDDDRSVRIKAALDDLPEKERSVLELRYGLADGTSYPLRETARKLELSAEGVRKLEERALSKLQDMSALQALREAA